MWSYNVKKFPRKFQLSIGFLNITVLQTVKAATRARLNKCSRDYDLPLGDIMHNAYSKLSPSY